MLDIGELSTIPAGCKLFKKEADVEISVVLLDEIVPVELYLLQFFFLGCIMPQYMALSVCLLWLRPLTL